MLSMQPADSSSSAISPATRGCSVRYRKRVTMQKFVISTLLLGLFSAAALAQPANFNTTGPGDIVQAFRDGAKLWTLGIIPYAKSLFWLLALLDFAWTAACLLLEGAEFHGWTTAIVR